MKEFFRERDLKKEGFLYKRKRKRRLKINNRNITNNQ